MEKTRIAVLVSGGGTNLQAILDAQKSGIISSGSVEIVISNKAGVYALTRAESFGIKSAVVEKKSYATQSDFEDALIALLEENSIDMIVLAGFMSILSEKFTGKYANRIINIHPSLIPSFCGKGCYGLRVHEMALAYGVKVSGATVHYVNEIPDGGKIIMQKAVYIKDGDTPEILQRRIMEEAEWVIFPRAVEQVASEISVQKQNRGE